MNPKISTHKERIQACINQESLDRPPVALWRHFPVDDQDPKLLAQATLHFQRRYDFDLVKVTPASSLCVKDWGVEDEWRGHTEGTRQYKKHVIRDPRDWESLPVLEPTASHLAGGETLITHLRIYPEAVMKGLTTIAETTRRFVEACLATGIDGVFYAIQH